MQCVHLALCLTQSQLSVNVNYPRERENSKCLSFMETRRCKGPSMAPGAHTVIEGVVVKETVIVPVFSLNIYMSCFKTFSLNSRIQFQHFVLIIQAIVHSHPFPMFVTKIQGGPFGIRKIDGPLEVFAMLLPSCTLFSLDFRHSSIQMDIEFSYKVPLKATALFLHPCQPQEHKIYLQYK